MTICDNYRRKTRTNYTLNFYDKTDWIANQRKRGCQISKEDDAFAKDILRLEVQASYVLLDAISKKHHIERTFGNFFTYDITVSEDHYLLRCLQCRT